MTHPFEKAGLGKAPFVCTGVSEKWHGEGESRKPGGCCSYCATGILYQYHIKSSDGKTFVVGSDCVTKTFANVQNFKQVKRDFAAKKREAKREENRKKWKAEAEERERQRKIERDETYAIWSVENKDILDRIMSYTGYASDFMKNMVESIDKWGKLTDKQYEAVKKIFDKEDATEAARNTSNWLECEIGDRMKNIDVKITECKCIGYSDDWLRIPRVMVSLETKDGNVLVWWTSKIVDIMDSYVTASFTIKDFSEFNGVKQTIVTRVMVK